MEQTAHYQLSQWDAEDRILREDFNANNAKLEQALAAETEARQVAIAELAQKAGTHLIHSVTLSSATSTLDVSLADVNWSQWNTVRITMIPVQPSNGTYNVRANNGSLDLGFADNRIGSFLLMLYPSFDSQLRIMGHYWPPYSGNQIISNSAAIQTLTQLRFSASNGDFQAGTVAKVWGIK